MSREVAGQTLGMDRLAVAIIDDEPRRRTDPEPCGLLGLSGVRDLGEVVRHRKLPSSALRLHVLAQDDFLALVAGRLADANLSLLDVNVAPAEPEDLSAPHPGSSADDEREVLRMALRGLDDPEHVLVRRRVDTQVGSLGKLDALRRVRCWAG